MSEVDGAEVNGAEVAAGVAEAEVKGVMIADPIVNNVEIPCIDGLTDRLESNLFQSFCP